jgi:two-component system invasion response regulator UvrY
VEEVGSAVAKVVVCDDDPVVRASITTVCEDAGLEVVAETDSGGDAAEMVRRFGVDVLVLDLSLSDGSGERAIELLVTEEPATEIVVYTAYASDPARLLKLGVREVVQKPDFDLLASVLASVGTSVDASTQTSDRRVASREVVEAPKLWRSPAGVSSHHDLAHSVLEMEVGDAALAVTVVGLEALEADVGPLLTADCRLAVAGSLREELRIQDLLHEAPEIGGFVALLRGGDARAAGAVWSRFTAVLRTSSLPGEVKGAASRVDTMGPSDAIARAIGALHSAAVGSPSFVSV